MHVCVCMSLCMYKCVSVHVYTNSAVKDTATDLCVGRVDIKLDWKHSPLKLVNCPRKRAVQCVVYERECVCVCVCVCVCERVHSVCMCYVYNNVCQG